MTLHVRYIMSSVLTRLEVLPYNHILERQHQVSSMEVLGMVLLHPMSCVVRYRICLFTTNWLQSS